MTAAINGHRRLRGPYTIGAALLRRLTADALERSPDLVEPYDIEIRAVAPELRARVPARRQTIDAGLPEDERILVPAPRRTLRLANGIAEFVRRCLDTDACLIVDKVHEADPTDRELLAVLMRRVPRLTVVLCSPDPPYGPGFRLVNAPPVAGTMEDFISSDGTSDDPLALADYRRFDPRERARRHSARAAELGPEALLGALPYHLENGQDPAAGAEAVWRAVDRCVAEGFLDAVAELGPRGLRLAEPGSELWWRLIHRTATALGGLGRQGEARDLYERARRGSVEPSVHAAAAYGLAMLDARHPDPAGRDLGRATGWINQAIAISTLLPDRRERAFKLGFDQNARALIELRQGRTEIALELVEGAIELADTDLPAGEHPVHRMVLLANRAQLLARTGRPKDALADLDRAIAIDPVFPDHYLDRGNLRLRLGQTEDALADYETAIAVSPPLPEAYYNRAELYLSVGDPASAKADLDHVLELDPGFLSVHQPNRRLLEMLDEHEAARRDVVAGLELDPANPYLHGVLGQLETAAGRFAEARDAFDIALAGAPELASAWANRAILRFESGDVKGAVADFSRSLELAEDPAVYFNRATALRAMGRFTAATDDLHRALDLDPADPDVRKALDELG